MTGVAWSSSARALRCSVKSVNERNPRRMLYVSCETAGFTSEEGEDDVRSAWPLCLGRHRRYNGWYKGLRSSNVKPIPKNQSQFGLRSATRPHEVGIASTVNQPCHGEYVPGSCTHRPSSHERQRRPKSRYPPRWGVPKVKLLIGTKS